MCRRGGEGREKECPPSLPKSPFQKNMYCLGLLKGQPFVTDTIVTRACHFIVQRLLSHFARSKETIKQRLTWKKFVLF